jgi:hypothetical protein
MSAASSAAVIPFESASQTNVATEPHYSVFEVAEMWKVSADTVRRIFANEEDVLIFGSKEGLHKRKRETMRIPLSVLLRVHAKYHSRRAA